MKSGIIFVKEQRDEALIAFGLTRTYPTPWCSVTKYVTFPRVAMVGGRFRLRLLSLGATQCRSPALATLSCADFVQS
jgi:hypothetical protein